MKKNVFYLFVLICVMSLFTSCGDDDNTKVSPNGTYSGDLRVVFTMGDIPFLSPIDSKEIVQLVKGSSDNKFSFSLKNFMIELAPGKKTGVGNIDIKDIDLVAAGHNKYTFSKDIPDFEITTGDKEGVLTWIGPGLKKLHLTLNGTIEGGKVKIDLATSIEISVATGYTEMSITVGFTGTK